MNVAMVQLEMKQCWTEKQFYEHIKRYYEEAKFKAEIIAFPEDIGFCLAWVKECKNVRNIRANIEIEKLGVKSWFESLIDYILNKLNLKKMGEWLSQKVIENIIKRTFSRLSKEYNIISVSGSTYVRKSDGLYNVCYVFENGKLIGEYEKHKIVSIEKAWGVKEGRTFDPIVSSKAKIGLVICYDLDDEKFMKSMCEKSDFIVAPSGGYRPYPNYPFDFAKETPQIQRSMENEITILRPYCAGWLFPGIYFQGLSMAVNNGKIICKSKHRDKGEIMFVDVDLKTQI